MFFIGTMWMNGYCIYIALPSPFEKYTYPGGVKNLPFYDISISRRDPRFNFDVYYYVNPVKEILQIDLSERNPLMHPKDKENLTPEELEFRTEHFSYWHRVTLEKQTMPSWKLSKQHIERILEIISTN